MDDWASDNEPNKILSQAGRSSNFLTKKNPPGAYRSDQYCFMLVYTGDIPARVRSFYCGVYTHEKGTTSSCFTRCRYRASCKRTLTLKSIRTLPYFSRHTSFFFLFCLSRNYFPDVIFDRFFEIQSSLVILKNF